MNKSGYKRLSIFKLPVLFILLFVFNRAYGASCSLILKNTDLQQFSASHFPQSKMWIGIGDTQFDTWAAQQANLASKKLQQGLSSDKVFSSIANERKALEEHVTYRNKALDRTNSIGVLRSETDHAVWSSMGSMISPDWNHKSDLIVLIFSEHPLLDENSFDLSKTFSETRYISKESRVFTSTAFAYSFRDGLKIIHPPGLESHFIMLDVYERIDSFRNDKNLEDFIISMQGYFNAMPYHGGSSSIGRIFFSALFHSVYNKTLTLPEDIDVLAMALPRDKFIQLISNLIVQGK